MTTERGPPPAEKLQAIGRFTREPSEAREEENKVTNEETNVPEAIYAAPAVVCRFTLTREGLKIEAAVVEEEGRALLVFRNEEEAESWRREWGLYPAEEGFKVLPAEDEMLRDLLQRHGCTQVITPNSWLGEDRADFFTAENFMRILEEGVPV
jgi:hypothetical protein